MTIGTLIRMAMMRAKRSRAKSGTILVDHDEAGMRAAAECSARWTAAGRTVHRIVPRTEGQDMADLV
jgi:hypothetical protein